MVHYIFTLSPLSLSLGPHMFGWVILRLAVTRENREVHTSGQEAMLAYTKFHGIDPSEDCLELIDLQWQRADLLDTRHSALYCESMCYCVGAVAACHRLCNQTPSHLQTFHRHAREILAFLYSLSRCEVNSSRLHFPMEPCIRRLCNEAN
jgi:hypothetical protein